MRLAINVYDEGIQLTDAQLVLAGEIPYRDFYLGKPAGSFLALAAVFKTFGPSVISERAFGFAVRAGCAVLAGMIAGRLNDRRFSALAAGMAALWLSTMIPDAMSYFDGLGLMLATALLIGQARRTARRGLWVLAGATLGCVGCFRLDQFAWSTGLLALCAIVSAVSGAPSGGQTARPALWFAAGTALTALPFWLCFLALAGPDRLWTDLIGSQLGAVAPGRRLPMPELLAATPAAGLPFPVPAVIFSALDSGLAIALLGPIFAFVTMAALWREKRPIRFDAALLAGLTLVVLPELFARTDDTHVIFTVTPALIALAVLIERGALSIRRSRRRRRLAVCAAAATAAAWATLPVLVATNGSPRLAIWRTAPQPAYPASLRAGMVADPMAESRGKVLAFIASHTCSPRDPIYIGAGDHRRVYINEMDLYFLANRIGGTRYMQFDPNIQSRPDIQAAMIEELERAEIRLVVLSTRFDHVDGQPAPLEPGADILDRYLADAYETALESGPYTVKLRRRTADCALSDGEAANAPPAE